MSITRKQGSATSPRPAAGETVIIAHLANDCGAWGAGFVLAVNQLDTEPRARYRLLAAAFGAGKDKTERIPRGIVQFVPAGQCDGKILVANMVAQKGVGGGGDLVDYDALGRCLDRVFDLADEVGAEVHIPSKMGAGLAGGNATKIQQIIDEKATERGVSVVLWEFSDSSAASFVP